MGCTSNDGLGDRRRMNTDIMLGESGSCEHGQVFLDVRMLRTIITVIMRISLVCWLHLQTS